MPASAQDATHCIAQRQKGNAPSLVNTCDFKIEVHWCTTNVVPTGLKTLPCHGPYFYTQSMILDSHEDKTNTFNVPAGGQFSYAACKGTYGSLVRLNDHGGFWCRQLGEKEDFVTITKSGTDQEKVCQAALADAPKAAAQVLDPGMCSCSQHGPTVICRLVALRSEPQDRSLLDKGNDKLVDYLRSKIPQCVPSEKIKCLAKLAATGVRG